MLSLLVLLLFSATHISPFKNSIYFVCSLSEVCMGNLMTYSSVFSLDINLGGGANFGKLYSGIEIYNRQRC